MNLKALFLVGTLLGSAGLAFAAKGEEIQEIDLTAVNGKIYFLGCQNGSGFEPTSCGILGIWEQTNEKPGLQKGPSTGAASYKKDQKVTL
jgi:hypothetical protein